MQIREGFVASAGHRLAYLAVNEHLASEDEPAIVFIHGVLASVNFWRDCLPPEFAHDRPWYALSLPAHHPSTVPADFAAGQVDEQWFFEVMNGALAELLDQRKAIVVGHSTGGFAALNLAIHQAPNLLGVVSIAGFHSGQWGGVEGLLVKLAGLGRWAKAPFTANIALAARSTLIQQQFASLLAHDRKAYLASPLSLRMLDNVGPNTREQNPAALFPLFSGIGSLEIADQLHRIQVPCYLFAGSHDPVVPAEQSLLMASRIPQVNTVVFHQVGHMPFMEDTEAFFTALEDALADIAGHPAAATQSPLSQAQ